MGNIVGPHGPGVRETTTRPADSASGSALDTWFEDCVAGNPATGTKLPAVWLNKVAALFRRAIRGMGVPEVEAGPASDDMLLEAIRRGATLANVGTGSDIYAGQDAASRHLIRRLAAGSNVTITPIEGPAGEHALRIAVTVPGSGPTGNTLGNVGDGADVYKGTNGTVEELRGIKGIGPISSAVSGDNVEVGLSVGAWTVVLRNNAAAGQAAGVGLLGLTEEANPAAADVVLLAKAADGALRHARIDKVRGGVASFVAAGVFNASTTSGAPTVNSASGQGCSIAASPVAGRVRVTFSAALPSTRYVVLLDDDGFGGGGHAQVKWSEKTTAYVDIWLNTDMSRTGNVQFIVALAA